MVRFGNAAYLAKEDIEDLRAKDHQETAAVEWDVRSESVAKKRILRLMSRFLGFILMADSKVLQ